MIDNDAIQQKHELTNINYNC